MSGYYHLSDMDQDARVNAGAAYRGFLFSDMRGFTAFSERYGNTAAAAKVGRFLEIARKAIARHEGAEIKTEGDAIHAVFMSASSAVLCGLEIQDAATEQGVHEPDGAFNLGVGVHAGEAVETAEGYIGRAVNIAARLCAAAEPGEVLVSSTVKGITQASITVGFVPRGKRRLKGIEDPILVYAVTRDATARARREIPRSVVLGAAGLGFAIAIAIAAVVGSQLLAGPVATPTPPPSAAPVATPAAKPVEIGQLPIGKYASQGFQPPITFDIADPGWTANRDRADLFGLLRDADPGGSVTFLRVQEVIDGPCDEGGAGAQTGLGAADLVAEMRGLWYLQLTDPEPVLVGGYTGEQVEVKVDTGALAACGGLVGQGASLFHTGEEAWQATPGEDFRLIAVNIEGEAVTILINADWEQPPSVEELENLLKLGQRVVDSVEF